MNNYQKIKNMTLDEMAEWLEYFVYAYTSGNICYEDAKEILLESEGQDERLFTKTLCPNL